MTIRVHAHDPVKAQIDQLTSCGGGPMKYAKTTIHRIEWPETDDFIEVAVILPQDGGTPEVMGTIDVGPIYETEIPAKTLLRIYEMFNNLDLLPGVLTALQDAANAPE